MAADVVGNDIRAIARKERDGGEGGGAPTDSSVRSGEGLAPRNDQDSTTDPSAAPCAYCPDEAVRCDGCEEPHAVPKCQSCGMDATVFVCTSCAIGKGMELLPPDSESAT